MNGGIAEHCAHAPERLLGLGTAPLQHPDLAVHVLTRAISDGLRGVEVSTNVAGRELSDPVLDAFWTLADELDAVVFVHPWGCTLGERLDVGYMANSVGNPTETTVALARLITTGTLDRHPGLSLLAAHGGGYLPAGVARLDHAWHARADARSCAEPPSSYLRRLWFDALVYTPEALRTLVVAVRADRVALGATEFTLIRDAVLHRCHPSSDPMPPPASFGAGLWRRSSTDLFGQSEVSPVTSLVT